jgi:hypothetical protein
VCKGAELGGTKCLSADNRFGRACNADGTPMTEEQQRAAAIGACPGRELEGAWRQ